MTFIIVFSLVLWALIERSRARRLQSQRSEAITAWLAQESDKLKKELGL